MHKIRPLVGKPFSSAPKAYQICINELMQTRMRTISMVCATHIELTDELYKPEPKNKLIL